MDEQPLTFVLPADARTWYADPAVPVNDLHPRQIGHPSPSCLHVSWIYHRLPRSPLPPTDWFTWYDLQVSEQPSQELDSQNTDFVLYTYIFSICYFKFCVDPQTLSFHLWPLLRHHHGEKESQLCSLLSRESVRSINPNTLCVVSNALYSISSLTSMLDAFSVTALSSFLFC